MIFKTHKNTLTAYGTIWSGEGMYFEDIFKRLENDYNDITVRLHTYGGSVFDGNLIYNTLNKSTKNVTIIVDGIAASMGGLIMLSRQDVKIVENGYVMIHAPSGGGRGNAKDLEGSANLLRLVEKNFITKFTQKTGKSKEEVTKWMDGSNYWFDAQQCLEMGLVNEIIPNTVETPLPVEAPEDMGDNKVFALYGSLLTTDVKEITNFKSEINNNMKQPLIDALSLAGVTAQSSDTAILQAVQEKLQAVEAERDNLQNQLNNQVKDQVEALLNANKDSFKEDKREVYQKIGETQGIEALTTVLNALGAKSTPPKISNLITNKGEKAPNADWNYEDWMEKDPEGLEKMSEEEPEKYNDLVNKQYKKYLS